VILGFTGARLGVTQAQRAALSSVIVPPDLVLHGGAKGADAQFHAVIAEMLGPELPLPIEVYPGESARWTYWNYASDSGRRFRVHPTAPPLDRNRAIVSRCDHLLACPDGPERTRSGTWTTVRYARRAGKPVTIIMPDGTVLEEKK